jgi:hypothetical protein
VPLEMTEGNYSNVGHRGPVYKGLGAMNPCDNLHLQYSVMASRTSNQTWSKGLDAGTYCQCSLFSKKIEYPDGSPSQLKQISGVLQYFGLHVNCRILLSVYGRIRSFSTDLRQSPVPNLTKIFLVGAAQVHANGRPDRQDEAKWRFVLFIRIRLNNELLHSTHYKGTKQATLHSFPES